MLHYLYRSELKKNQIWTIEIINNKEIHNEEDENDFNFEM